MPATPLLNSGYRYPLTVRPSESGQTVAALLAARYPHSSPAEWAARVQAGEAELAGQRAGPHTTVQPGQTLIWQRPPWQEPAAPREFQLIWHDAHLLAVDKPSGLPTLPGGGFLLNTLLSVVQEQFPGAAPLHRLGRGTSGLVLFARTPQAAAALSAAWRQHAVSKVYRALASGVVVPDQATVTVPIGPVPHPRLGRVYAASPTGKPARSEAAVLERRSGPGGEGRTLLDVQIQTGRPHQIRIHLASLGHPLLGDPLYAPGGGLVAELPGLPGDLGYWLHAHRLACVHPYSGRVVTLEAAPPPELELTAGQIVRMETIPRPMH